MWNSSTDIVENLVMLAHAMGKPVILSFHDFKRTPSR